jgi:hypothetical protein
LYTNNNKPYGGNLKKQAPLFLLEQHFSKYFIGSLWGSIDATWQIGGETSLDGKKNDDAINQFGAGATVGYDFFDALTLMAGYGRLWFTGDNGQMWKLGAIVAIPSKSDMKMYKAAQKTKQAN